jgi:4a-hydroxytetrahydrobiopterin dehydratase
MAIHLIGKKCVSCEGDIPPFTPAQIAEYRASLKTNWEVVDGKKLHQEFKFKDFTDAMIFVNKVADLAENEGHHPDLHIFYNRVIVELTTHAIKGLSENDFIVAAKIEVL